MSAQGCWMSPVSLRHAAALLPTDEAALMPERRLPPEAAVGVRWNRARTAPRPATSRSSPRASPPAGSSGESRSGASDASTGVTRPSTHQPARPPLLTCPCPSYRQFVQKALVGIIKLCAHAEPADASRSADCHRQPQSDQLACLADERDRLDRLGVPPKPGTKALTNTTQARNSTAKDTAASLGNRWFSGLATSAHASVTPSATRP
jgi:hypothetical protein